MSENRFRAPKLCCHKSSNRAYVKWKGKRHYLGKWGTPEAQQAYAEFVDDLRRLYDESGKWTTSIKRLAVDFLTHADAYYRRPDGTATSEAGCYRDALRIVISLFGDEPASSFGPKKLKVVQAEMAKRYVRTTANRHLSRVKHVFGWGVANELVPAETADALKYVPGLKAGRSSAAEPEPVKPVAMAVINATLPHLPSVVREMVKLQLKTGARPSEVRLMKPSEIDTSGELWVYVPSQHKNAYRGKNRVIQIGPQGQEILRRAMEGKGPDDYIFSPTMRDRKPQDSTRPYRMDTYRRAIGRGCENANVEVWSPNQLRHTAATEIRKFFDLDSARAVLGHAEKDTTEIYAEADLSKAAEIMLAIG